MSAMIRLARSTTHNQTPTPKGAADIGEVSVNIPDRRVFVLDEAGNPVIVADRTLPFDASRDYLQDDLVVYDNYLWRAPAAVEAGAFNSAQWLKIGSEQINEGILTQPQSVDRNTINLTSTPAVKGLRILGAATQTAPLLSIPGTSPADTRAAEVDAQGFPGARFGASVFRMVQANHPFTFRGQPLAYNGAIWVLANASQSTLRAIGVIEQIIDANTFVVRVAGRISDLQSGAFAGGIITPGSLYYVSDAVAGQLTSTPSTIRPDPVLTAISTTSGILAVGTGGSGSDYVQVTGDTMSGPLTMGGQQQVRFSDNTAYLQRSASTPSIMVGVASTVAARFDERTTAAAYDETVVTRMKGDARYARLSGGAGARFVGGVTVAMDASTGPDIRLEGGGLVTADANLSFRSAAGNVEIKRGGSSTGGGAEGTAVALFDYNDDGELPSDKSVVTRRKGDARYLREGLKAELFTEIVNHLYPIGWTIMNTNGVNPSSRLPGTTWVLTSQGRAIVGVGTADGVAWTAKQTRGTAEVALTEAQLPSHRHLNNPPNADTGGSSHAHVIDPPATNTTTNGAHDHGYRSGAREGAEDQIGTEDTNFSYPLKRTTVDGAHLHTVNIAPFATTPGGAHVHFIPDFWSGFTGGGAAHTNLQPSMAFYVWERTA